MKIREENKLGRQQTDTGIIIPGFDEIIFKNRNREYGAYQIRKKYYSALVTGTVITCIIASVLLTIPLLSVNKTEYMAGEPIRTISVQMDELEPPVDEIYIPPAPPPPGGAKVVETVRYVPPVVVDSVPPTEEQPVVTDIALVSNTDEQVELPSGDGFGIGDDLLSGDGMGDDGTFFIVEVMPSFRGGDLDKFREWVQKRTNYPQEAIDNRIQGRVSITFVVEPDGSVTNVTVLKGVHPLIDNEAVKAIQASPKWSPGLQRGKPVRVRYVIWLTFLI
ncbi:MAG: energy transducer TonB [Bacteroidales bacterium]|nr:energy transducer TonB [Bacteroidales bacterium]